MKRNPSTLLRARKNRTDMTKAEKLLWKLLRDRRLFEHKFRRQHPIEIYVVDFACASAKLVLETDGPAHDDPEQLDFDKQRTEYLRESGWRVLRVKDDDVFGDIGAVARRIAAALEGLSG